MTFHLKYFVTLAEYCTEYRQLPVRVYVCVREREIECEYV